MSSIDTILQGEATNALAETVVHLIDSTGAPLSGMGGGVATIKLCKSNATAFTVADPTTTLTELTDVGNPNGEYRFRLGSVDRNVGGVVAFKLIHASINGGYVAGYLSVQPPTRLVDLSSDVQPVSSASIIDHVLDPDAPVGAQTLGESINLLTSYVAGEAEGFPQNIVQQPIYKSVGGNKIRLQGVVSQGKRTLVKADGS